MFLTFYPLFYANYYVIQRLFLPIFYLFLPFFGHFKHTLKFMAQNKFMLVIFFRAIIIFVTLIVIMRLMGKRQIGEMQPFEFIITLLIAELACVPMTDVSIPLIYGIVSVFAVFILHQALTLLEQSCTLFRRIVDGKPSVVINKCGVDVKELKKNNMDVSDLIESLRSTGNFSLDSVHYAIYESNGKLSVLKSENSTTSEQMPILIVSCGRVQKNNLKLLDVGNDFITDLMKTNRIARLKDIQILTLDGGGNVYLQVKGQNYKTFKITLPNGVSW